MNNVENLNEMKNIETVRRKGNSLWKVSQNGKRRVEIVVNPRDKGISISQEILRCNCRLGYMKYVDPAYSIPIAFRFPGKFSINIKFSIGCDIDQNGCVLECRMSCTESNPSSSHEPEKRQNMRKGTAQIIFDNKIIIIYISLKMCAFNNMELNKSSFDRQQCKFEM